MRILALLLILTPLHANADFEWLKPELQKWKSDTKTFMQTTPTKVRTAPATQHSFEAKLAQRAALLRNSLGRYSEILDRDHAEDVIDPVDGVALLDRLSDMDAAREGQIPQLAWSDSYWPLFKGALGARYRAPGFPYFSDFPAYEQHSQETVEPNVLSPVEKYELLVGDRTKSLHDFMWSKGRYYYEKNGHVAEWMGVCNGWSYAALNLPRPRHSVVVKTQDAEGKAIDLTLYPSDIKALGSFLWSQRKLPIRFVGHRCNVKNPEVDENGRILPTSPECVDSNPGTFHKAIVNQIGLRKRNLIFDASYDYEVWNYPIQSYKYTYFNPKTGAPVDTLAEATIARADFTEDPYAAYRSANAVTIAGIAVEVAFTEEVDPPSVAEVNSETEDSRSTVRYMYDLELDAEGRIIGGEWYQNAHPDFLWTRPYGLQPASAGDFAVQGAWDGSSLLPEAWKNAAAISAAQGELTPAVILKIFELSAQ